MPCAVVECKGMVKFDAGKRCYRGLRSRSVWLTWREKQLHAMGRHLTLEHLYVCRNCIDAIDRSAGRGRWTKEKIAAQRASDARYRKRKRLAAAAVADDDDDDDDAEEAKEVKTKAKKK